MPGDPGGAARARRRARRPVSPPAVGARRPAPSPRVSPSPEASSPLWSMGEGPAGEGLSPRSAPSGWSGTSTGSRTARRRRPRWSARSSPGTWSPAGSQGRSSRLFRGARRRPGSSPASSPASTPCRLRRLSSTSSACGPEGAMPSAWRSSGWSRPRSSTTSAAWLRTWSSASRPSPPSSRGWNGSISRSTWPARSCRGSASKAPSRASRRASHAGGAFSTAWFEAGSARRKNGRPPSPGRATTPSGAPPTAGPWTLVGPRGACLRTLSHVKVVCAPDRRPEAKVYLAFGPSAPSLD